MVGELQGGCQPPSALKLAIQRYVFATDSTAEVRQAASRLLRFIRTTLSLRDPVPPRDGTFMRSVAFEGEPDIDLRLQNAPIWSAQQVLDRLGEDMELLSPTHWSL